MAKIWKLVNEGVARSVHNHPTNTRDHVILDIFFNFIKKFLNINLKIIVWL